MIQVTDPYKEAVAAVTRSEKIKGYIMFKNGEKLQITDENIVQGSLIIDEQICFGSFQTGTFNSAQMKLAIYDDNAMNRDFTNALVSLNHGLLLGGGAYYYIPLGKYNVDGSLLKRRRDRVFLTAFDNSVRFGMEKPPADKITGIGVHAALKKLCSASKVSFAMTEEDILALPNGDMKITLTDPQMQTNRDCVMWIAALLGCYAKINREGKLEIKKTGYVSDTETGEIFPDWLIGGDERKRTVFSDTRTYAKYMTGYSAGRVKQYRSLWKALDEQAVEGSLMLPQNPIIKKFTENEADKVNRNICESVSRFLQRGIETDIFGNPALECGDTIRLSGGVLDIGRKIIGVVTRRIWQYRKNDRLYCQIHDVWTPVDDDEDESTGENGEDGEYVYITPKQQTEKRIDALFETVSTFKAENPVEYFNDRQTSFIVNGTEYCWEKNAGGFIEKVWDSNNNVFYPIPPETGESERYNSILLSVLLARGIKSNEKPRRDFVTRWDLRKGGDGTTLTIPSQPGTFDCLVDWGDGNVTRHTSGSLVHKYASIPSDGIVTVSISGQYNGTCMENLGINITNRLVEIVRWGNVGFTSMKDAFWGCVYLTKLPSTPITGAENVTDFSYSFYMAGAKGYEVGEYPHVPDYFFSNCKNAESFSAAFFNNNLGILVTFGKGLFKGCGKAKNFTITFMCIGDMTIDNEMFEGCASASDFTRCFGGDTVGFLDIADRAFVDCVNITSLVNFTGYDHSFEMKPTWFNLESMRGKTINFNLAFQDYGSTAEVLGTAPDFWNYINPSSNVTRCFRNCVNLTNYNEIPSTWK